MHAHAAPVGSARSGRVRDTARVGFSLRRDLSEQVDWRFAPQGGWRAFTRRHQRYAEAKVCSESGKNWRVVIGRPTGVGHLTAALKPVVDAAGANGGSTTGSSWLLEVASPSSNGRSRRTVHREFIRWDALVAPTANAIVAMLQEDVPLPE